MTFMRPSRLLSTINRPLNVLFFGSDQFSIHSLRALDELKRQGSKVGEIQLVTRSPKWCGRQNSVLKYPPIVEAARGLGLREPFLCDSRQDLVDLGDVVRDEHYNLIVAVSFGKLIPAELINRVPFALNIHPSLLPRYKGASPIQHALLNADETTGVTIQTLHPSKFDQGCILAQTRALNIEELLSKGTVSYFDDDVPRATATLMDQLGLEGSKLLQKVITQDLYTEMQNNEADAVEPSYAPKITTEMKHINWNSQDAASLVRRLEVLGPLFTYKKTCPKQKDTAPVLKRIILHQFQIATKQPQLLREPGDFMFDEETSNLLVKCEGSSCIQVRKIQFEGFKVEDAKQFITSLRKRCGKTMAEQTVFL
ncbi:hypothetical protein HG536_0D04590 [Torulaspora globosa]|uniref:Methionyl-tRNA formyltransferase, mitochondrial n=1 Tax=Torulaspora globosa TaxID=48254 RepID=A0A7G3ZHF1_9SACH|nr:uncharacterized protein HG536_0D04590 [Torulaspora globosa]QLL32937.1 hypothetical protein HG536_0D04590 [Torulaspora globosa]